MADFYQSMAAFANDILAPTSQGGLGQGIIQLVRYVEGPPPANPWDPPAPQARQVTTIKGAVRGVGAELAGTEVAPGNIIVASDRIIIAAPWGGTYAPTDVIEIDGRPVTVMAITNIPEAGTVSAIRFIVRGG